MTDLVFATEDMPYCPKSEQPVYYTYTKAEAEKLVLGPNRRNGLCTAVIRGTALPSEGDNAMPTQIGCSSVTARTCLTGPTFATLLKLI
ncbi:uncharacterized protein CC84DRAFT_1166939 [Paraphaeosphaeria sporulosa]|uniref:3-beta hydroxysteroid dehydrogenase/isomerase domain-containing protein n=1 Tax=Paraphaeosphaeria sporulosa TaxID=1460663 RepID=A0A177C7U3_9PLEO|nr:uncharacterized protein CC84DRAFT_1166939 [Paraphaeosphaeria sporulosa]OAG03201.1 hypothetical protein CC84DRAFT_1166939 [Paraphaeosphaeria sporulosa]